ncbi:NUMOD4 motif-containing HNH endonuclease [Novosphingobium colocasiae]|uniref:NUMOD4 motif-containing HNH endonuclease n=1 Tax=Novosphingobium colocasiae TaxID=1256513 RepID=UPI0035B1B51F
MEVWKPIPYSLYEASTEGRIRNTVSGSVQSPQLGRDGYLFVGVRFLDRKHSIKVHVLVCLAFHGVKPAGAECVRHLDGDRMNNRPSNLRWGTNLENAADTILHGRQVAGFDHPNMRISKDEALAIRAEYLLHMQDRKKAANGFILNLSARYPELGYKCVYKAATGRYDSLMPGEVAAMKPEAGE